MGKEERVEWLDYLENQAEFIWNNTIHEVGRLSTKNSFPATNYSADTEKFEMFARWLFMVNPLIANGRRKYLSFILDGIVGGTDKNNANYWGDVFGATQSEVEFFSVLFTVYSNKEILWDRLSDSQKKNLEEFFFQINKGSYPKTNWLFFKLLVNVIIDNLTGSDHSDIIGGIKKDIDNLYIGDGWYKDGKMNTIDYYNGFAFHFYGLIYSGIRKDDYAEKCIERALLFAEQYKYLFSAKGEYVPYGRSLTYRFAPYAFWGALVYAGIREDAFVKGIITRGLSYWKNAINVNNAIDTVGYLYTNPFMGEEYNGYGSSLWAFKAYIFLIGEHDSFWNSDAQEFPTLEHIKCLEKTNALIARDEQSDIITLFPNGVCFDYGMLGFSAKYMKFAYNNRFAFSVPRGQASYAAGGFDSTITVEIPGGILQDRNEIKYSRIVDGIQISKWKIGNLLTTKTYIIPGANRHYRVHFHNVKKRIVLYESGFSIKEEGNVRTISDGFAKTEGNEYFSQIRSVVGNGIPSVVVNFPNTNVCLCKTEMPCLKWELTPGQYVTVSEVTVGDRNHEVSERVVDFKVSKDKVKFSYNGKNFMLDKDKYRIPGKTISIYLKRRAYITIKKALQFL